MVTIKMLSKINNITVFFEQGEKLTIPADYIKKFYISNINKNGDEIPYEESGITNKLIANFVMILFNDNTLNQNEFKIFKDNNIYSIAIKFKSSKTITFIIASAISPFLNNMEHNMYQKEYIFNNSKALLISEYRVKNITSLFI